MITVDKLLLKITNSSSPVLEEMISAKDSRVLRSLATSVSSNFFITENQSRLLVKILKENSKKMTEYTDEIDQALDHVMWSRRFRQLEQVKRVFIDKNAEHEDCIAIEFTFNSQIRKQLQSFSKEIENFNQHSPGKRYEASLTEQNIAFLVEKLKPLEFEFDETLEHYYEIIKSWSKEKTTDQFLITNITNPNFQRMIINDIGEDTEIDNLIIYDRRLRYQYSIKNDEKTEKNLSERLAYRQQSRVWVDKKTTSLEDIFSSLLELRRLPVMIVLDNGSDEKILKTMEFLDISLKNAGIEKNVGAYFRLHNTDTGIKFNKIIADNQYNNRLDINTEVVIVQSGKIPKFLLSNPWKPMSVIVMDSVMGMRHGKTAVYANCCDLIIEYADEPALRNDFIL